ncbi:MAG: hypothetical protein VZR09_00365 [Candidatus Gastranaerophilaceae bacterium]|nr:hypothetical protein [Candidatus Gastranaerophilaceae bacterium]
MSERSLSVSPVIEPFAGGVIGLGIGYTLAPRKYSLKRLLILNDDKFEKIYSKDLAENMSDKESKALAAIKNARKDYRESKNTVINQVRQTADNWRKKFEKVSVPENMENNLKESKINLQQAMKETDYIELNKKYRAAKENLKKSPDSEKLKLALNEANSALANARAIISSKIEIYRTNVRNITNEKLFQVKNNSARYAGVREAYHDFLAALAKRRTVSSNKLFELTNSKQLKKNYEIVKDFLPRARTKSAATGALVVGAITTLCMGLFNRSTRNVA